MASTRRFVSRSARATTAPAATRASTAECTAEEPRKIDLHPAADGEVHVYPEDYDAFIMSQRDAVQALSEKHRMMSARSEYQKRIDDLFMDIAKWGAENPMVDRIEWAPRTDDALITVIAADEDPEGLLHDEMSGLNLKMFKQYHFRLQFLLFRASEAEGLDSFLDLEEARRIYPAKPRSTSDRSR